MDANRQNLRRLLNSFAALSELGPALTAECDFAQTAPTVLSSVMEATAAVEGVLFRYTDRPSMLVSMAAAGYASFPEPALIPLLPRHVHNLSRLPNPVLCGEVNDYFSTNGNFAPQLFRCIAPVRVRGKLVGLLALGQRKESAAYDDASLADLSLLGHYVALGMHNHSLAETLSQRVSENLKLVATVHSFYDNTLEAFAAAIDFKHIHIHGHSLRVGRYAAGIAEALGVDSHEVAGIRAAGYLHDIGKIALDKALISKPSALAPEEFREIADHTTLGYDMVHDVHFPWPHIPEVVRWHHERADGTGYPDRVRLNEMKESVRIVALADSFDAMTSERPYRHSMSLGSTLRELIRLTPQKYDPTTMQGLLVQIRRDAVASMKPGSESSQQARFLDARLGAISPADVDQLASTLQQRVGNSRIHLA